MLPDKLFHSADNLGTFSLSKSVLPKLTGKGMLKTDTSYPAK